MRLDLTSSFDGLALPSEKVSPTSFYSPERSETDVNVSNSTNQTVQEVEANDKHEVVIKFDQDLWIDQNLFKQEKMLNFMTLKT